jgi:hypothetical protein
MATYLRNLLIANSGARGAQLQAFQTRIYDLLVKIKEELGIDELLLAIQDAKSIASSKVEQYLNKYEERVRAAVRKADEAANQYFVLDLQTDRVDGALINRQPVERSARNIEKLVAMRWKANYEVEMEDVNASMPLAQQIVSKYMSNFSAKAAPKV